MEKKEKFERLLVLFRKDGIYALQAREENFLLKNDDGSLTAEEKQRLATGRLDDLLASMQALLKEVRAAKERKQ